MIVSYCSMIFSMRQLTFPVFSIWTVLPVVIFSFSSSLLRPSIFWLYWLFSIWSWWKSIWCKESPGITLSKQERLRKRRILLKMIFTHLALLSVSAGHRVSEFVTSVRHFWPWASRWLFPAKRWTLSLWLKDVYRSDRFYFVFQFIFQVSNHFLSFDLTCLHVFCANHNVSSEFVSILLDLISTKLRFL